MNKVKRQVITDELIYVTPQPKPPTTLTQLVRVE
jgi:hypothetical protein